MIPVVVGAIICASVLSLSPIGKKNSAWRLLVWLGLMGGGLIGAVVAMAIGSYTIDSISDTRDVQTYMVHDTAIIIRDQDSWYYPDETKIAKSLGSTGTGKYVEEDITTPYLTITRTDVCTTNFTSWAICSGGETTKLLHIPRDAKQILDH